MSSRDDGDAEVIDRVEYEDESAVDDMISDVFDHLGRSLNDERDWDADDEP